MTGTVNWQSGTLEVLRYCQQLEVLAQAEVVGRWVWVRFDGRPAADIRTALKDGGFRWVQNRKAWAHCCGAPCRHGAADPRTKYATAPGAALLQEEVA